MARRIESKETIEKLIAEETIQHADCVNVTWGGIYWHEADEYGCNWSISTINGQDWEACLNRLRPFIANLRATVNIPDER